jgi:hypothetical protein
MNRRFYFIAILLTVVMSVFAQTTDDQKKKINSIKKSSAYLYAEITTNDQQTALDLAEDMLNQEINKYVAEQKKLRKAANIVLRNRQEAMESISLPRGNMYRAFKYVKKSDILAADNVEVRTNTAVVDANGNTTTVTTAVASTAISNGQLVVSEKRAETVKRLLAVQKFNELPQTLKQLKQEGRIGQYAKMKELSNPEKSVLLIYNREGNIEAVLGEGPNRMNLSTNQADSEKNYPGRGAFGVVVNE